MKKILLLGAALGWAGAGAAALADQPVPPGAPEPPPGPTAMTTPPLTGPLVANPNPMKFEIPQLGTIYATGQLTGLAMGTGNAVVGDKDGQFDISNGMAQIQKTDGMWQFYLNAGIYSLPTVGVGYVRASNLNNLTFGPLPVAYGKFAPTDEFSVQVGKLPTLIGAEYMYTFQNMNIERGLLWNQEPVVSKGVQFNYTIGALALSVSLNDGFYSDRYNWLSGLATWTIDKENILAVAAGGNFDQIGRVPIGSGSARLARECACGGEVTT